MIKVGFTGDFCPWMRVEEEFKRGNSQAMLDSVRPFFLENDLNVLGSGMSADDGKYQNQ